MGQAFRIYSNIYLQAHPTWATELIQYNHIFSTASSSYHWVNVYTYDKEFHMHMAKYPLRNLSIILQQAWTMFLKDRFKGRSGGETTHRGSSGNKGRKEICLRFNQGKCTAGSSCKYDHRCLECRKFRHGEHVCRKKLNKQGQGVASNTNSQPAVNTMIVPK